MRLTTVRTPSGTAAARVRGDTVELLPFADVGELLSQRDWQAAAAETSASEQLDLAGCQLAPVVLRPEKILCVGLNYAGHIREMSREPPEFPTLFAKYWRALLGAGDDIVLPGGATSMDWEAELAVIAARPLRHATEAEASEAVAGYCILNDITSRDWQNRTPQWMQGKTFEATTPVGPYLVTPDEVDDARDLTLTCEVNGQRVQDATTADLVFSPARLLAYISQIVTVMPGDLIATGTPAGVGHGMVPPTYLRAGDIVTTTIEGLGTLRNACVAEPNVER